MVRSLYAFFLVVITAMPAQAIDWPWQEEREVRHGFCKGFVLQGLAEDQVSDNSRTDFWLTWNYINRAELPDGEISETDIQQGRAHLSSLLESGDFAGIRDTADSECYLGRNRHRAYEEPVEA